MSEPLTRQLAGLPQAEPSPDRAERIRLRCRAQLERQARAASRAPAETRSTLPVWQPLILILGVAYLTEVLVQALRVYGLR